MSKPHLDHNVFTDVSWWHWVLTVPLLVVHLAGHRWAMPAAMGLCALAGCYFWYRLRQIKPYPVQVRIAYLGWSAIGMLPGMQWMHWIQLCGTTAMVTVGYCPLIRLLSVLPPNHTEPLTVSSVWRAFIKERCAGGLVKWPVRSSVPATNCCSLITDRVSISCSLPRTRPTTMEYHHARTHERMQRRDSSVAAPL